MHERLRPHNCLSPGSTRGFKDESFTRQLRPRALPDRHRGRSSRTSKHKVDAMQPPPPSSRRGSCTHRTPRRLTARHHGRRSAGKEEAGRARASFIRTLRGGNEAGPAPGAPTEGRGRGAELARERALLTGPRGGGSDAGAAPRYRLPGHGVGLRERDGRGLPPACGAPGCW